MELKNREGKTWELTEVDENTLKFILPPYSRVGFDNDPEKLNFIDPPGGPFLMIGSVVEDKKIIGFESKKDYVLIKTSPINT